MRIQLVPMSCMYAHSVSANELHVCANELHVSVRQ